MQAILLAAGRGVRLYPYTKDRPKCMMEFGGKTLIEISLQNLAMAGIEKVNIVVGYRHEMLEECLRQAFAPEFYQTIYNPDFHHGSGSSFMSAAPFIQGEFITVESDVLYSTEVIKRLISGPPRNLMTRGNFNHGRKEVKLYLDEHQQVRHAAWGDPDDPQAAGDWLGFTRFTDQTALALKQALEKAQLRNDKEINYEDFIFDLIPRFPFYTVDVDDLAWIEIDNQEDLERAKRQVFPRIAAEQAEIAA